jgi:antitoxin component YwqK of YwqJK toxin-antitoxin module
MNSLFEKEEKDDAINQMKIDLISRFYSLSKELIIKYADVLNFGRNYLMANENVIWDIELLEKFSARIEWDAIYKLNGIEIDYEFLRRFSDKIEFRTIPFSKKFNWSNKVIKEFGVKFDWSKGLVCKEQLSTIENLRLHKNECDWKIVSRSIKLSFTDEIIQEFDKYWVWENLLKNKNLPVSNNFIGKHIDKIDFSSLSQNPAYLEFILTYPEHYPWNWSKVAVNPAIVYNEKYFTLIYKYYQKGFEFTYKDKPFQHKESTKYFLANLFYSQSNDIIYFLQEKFENIIPFDILSKNCKIKLDINFIERHKHKLLFNETQFLSYNKDVITKQFVSKNSDLFDFTTNKIYNFPISIKLIENKHVSINWNTLSSNKTLDWSLEFIIKHFYKLNFNRLSENIGVFNNIIKKRMGDDEILTFLENPLHQDNIVESYYENGSLHSIGGKFNGSFKSYYENGQLEISANYLNGRLNGEYIKYLEDGTKYRALLFGNDTDKFYNINYFDANKSKVKNVYIGDEYFLYYECGRLQEYGKIYANGKFPEKEYWQDGLVKKLYNYIFNKKDNDESEYLIEITSYYSSKNIASKFTYTEDYDFHGDYEEYFENGKIKIKGKYIYGDKVGNWLEYFENGKLKSEGEYQFHNYKIGFWVEYFETGNIKESGKYILSNHSEWGPFYNNYDDYMGEGIHYYTLSVQDGKWIEYHENGKISSIGNYDNGSKVGNWKYYDFEGNEDDPLPF